MRRPGLSGEPGRIGLVAAVLALALAACGDGGGAATTVAPLPESTTTTSTPTTVPPATATSTATTPSTSTPTSTSSATTTTAPATTVAPGGDTPRYRVDPASVFPPDPLPGSAGAAGSGCVAGGGSLPDGVWFGYARAVSPGAVAFDLACFYFGDAAVTAAAADGITDVPNDYYIRNANPAIRDVPVAAGAMAWTIGTDPVNGFEEVPYTDWPPPGPTYTPCPGEFCTVWLYVNDGLVTEVLEQYLP